MKVYMMYVDKSEIMIGMDSKDRGLKEIYAVTNDKNLYKKFIHTRDMSKFKVKTIYVEGKEEYKQLAQRYRECVLEMSKIYSKSKNPYPKNLFKSFNESLEVYTFPITYLEKQSVREACDTFFEHAEIDIPNPYIFTDKLRRILKKRALDHIYKISRFPYMGDDSMYCTESEIEKKSTNYKMRYTDSIFLQNDTDYSVPDVWVDELEVFIEIYGNLMKLD